MDGCSIDALMDGLKGWWEGGFMDRSIDCRRGRLPHLWVGGFIDGWILDVALMYGWVDVWMVRLIVGSTKMTGGWVDHYMGGWIAGWIEIVHVFVLCALVVGFCCRGCMGESAGWAMR